MAGMLLVIECPHNKYGSAILIQNDMKVNKIYERVQGTVEIITLVMPGVVVHLRQWNQGVWKPAARQNDRREEENMGGSHHIDKHDSQ